MSNLVPEVSPCIGWMTSNETLRHVTSEHAEKLSKVAANIADTTSYEHFDLIYYDFEIGPQIELWLGIRYFIISNILP